MKCRRLAVFTLVSIALSIPAAAAAPVAFDWFEYTGRDAVFEQPIPDGSYRNPILAGFYPDPSICRVGDDFYLINSTFAYFPGIPIFHSRDLVHWNQLGHVIDRPSQLKYDGLGSSRGIFAPAISHHGDTFYIVCTMVDAGGNFLVTAKDPAGPWSDPIYYDFEGIDPSLFFDASTGRAWMLNNGAPEGEPLYEGHRAIWIQEFDTATQELTGERKVIVNGGVDLAAKPIWIEGPHLYLRDGWYYLCAAEGGTAEGHSQVILRGKAPTGPFEPWAGNPILTQRDLDGTAPGAVTSTGHADLVIGPDNNWWAVFLGCRPYGDRNYATGRETFMLPVSWTDDGWPQILRHGERVPFVVTGPETREHTKAPKPLTGNFSWRADFSGEELSALWIMLRAPQETWWTTDAEAGHISLAPRAEKLSGTGNPSYLGRRVQHARFDASTALEIPATPEVTAGLVAFQSETHHYFLGVRRTATGAEVLLEKASGGEPVVEASAAVDDATSPVRLRVQADDATLVFAYAMGTAEWTTLVPDADGTVLTTQAAGGFIGATVGVHARLEK